MKIKTRKIDSALKEKGFIAKERDHTFYFLVINGKQTKIHTKLSHGSKEYGDQLLSVMPVLPILGSSEWKKINTVF
ncbi:MAG: hypothetical protein ACNYWM_12655, partial [Methanosarcinales archaeon]